MKTKRAIRRLYICYRCGFVGARTYFGHNPSFLTLIERHELRDENGTKFVDIQKPVCLACRGLKGHNQSRL